MQPIRNGHLKVGEEYRIRDLPAGTVCMYTPDDLDFPSSPILKRVDPVGNLRSTTPMDEDHQSTSPEKAAYWATLPNSDFVDRNTRVIVVALPDD